MTRPQGVMQTVLKDHDSVRVCVCALLTNGSKVLLGHRSPTRTYYPNVWDFFGGHVKDRETNEAAIVREIREELGCIPKVLRYIDCFKEPNASRYGAGYFHVYAVTSWDGEPRLCNEEHDELRWVTLDEARNLHLADNSYLDIISRVQS